MFIIPKRLFEPTVMLFGLINSPAMFQTMINEILQDLINTGEITELVTRNYWWPGVTKDVGKYMEDCNLS